MSALTSRAFEPIWHAHPLVLVDIGAAGGIQSKWRAWGPCLKVIGFEPDARSLGSLGDGDESYLCLDTALGATREVRTLSLTRKPECSSFYPPNRAVLDRFPASERFDVLETREIEVEPLDEVLARADIADVDFMKVDVQGFELDVLRGALATLDRAVVGVEVEVEFQPLYQNQPLFTDVHDFLAALGFELFDLRPSHWRRNFDHGRGRTRGQVMFADALYFRPVEVIGERVGGMEDDDRARATAAHAAAAFLVHGYGGHAFAVLDAHAVLFDAGQRADIDKARRAWSRGPDIAGMPGARTARRLFRKLAQRLEPDF